MKTKHNKFRNTGLIYELLAKQVVSDTLSGKDSSALGILKSFYSGNNELVKEFKLYDIILKNKGITKTKADTVLNTVTEISKRFNHNSLKKIKYNLIKEIKQNYDLDEFFSIKIRDYKTLASIYCLIEASNTDEVLDPTSMVNSKLTILEHLTNKTQDENSVKDVVVEEYSKYSKDLKILTYKILLEKYNQKYDDLLTEQKQILREFINSMSSTTKLRNLVNNEVKIIKTRILENINKVDDITKIKVREIERNILPLSNADKPTDDTLANLMLYYNLVNELERL